MNDCPRRDPLISLAFNDCDYDLYVQAVVGGFHVMFGVRQSEMHAHRHSKLAVTTLCTSSPIQVIGSFQPLRLLSHPNLCRYIDVSHNNASITDLYSSGVYCINEHKYDVDGPLGAERGVSCCQ